MLKIKQNSDIWQVFQLVAAAERKRLEHGIELGMDGWDARGGEFQGARGSCTQGTRQIFWKQIHATLGK